MHSGRGPFAGWRLITDELEGTAPDPARSFRRGSRPAGRLGRPLRTQRSCSRNEIPRVRAHNPRVTVRITSLLGDLAIVGASAGFAAHRLLRAPPRARRPAGLPAGFDGDKSFEPERTPPEGATPPEQRAAASTTSPPGPAHREPVASDQASTRVLGSASARRAAPSRVPMELHALRTFVQHLTETSPDAGPSILANAGPSSKSATGHVNRGFVVKQGRAPGTARTIAPTERTLASCDWQYPQGRATWLSLESTVQPNQNVLGLVPSKGDLFPHRSLIRAGTGDWSQLVSHRVLGLPLVAGRRRERLDDGSPHAQRRCKRFDDVKPPAQRRCKRLHDGEPPAQRRCKRLHDGEPPAQRRCKRLHDVEPLAQRRCKRLHDVEPLAQRRCKRLHDVEPLAQRRCKRLHDVEPLAQRRCKRLHDVEPLAQRRCKRLHDVEPLAQRRCKRFDDVEPLAQRRCKRFDDVKPLAQRRCKRFDDGKLRAASCANWFGDAKVSVTVDDY